MKKLTVASVLATTMILNTVAGNVWAENDFFEGNEDIVEFCDDFLGDDAVIVKTVNTYEDLMSKIIADSNTAQWVFNYLTKEDGLSCSNAVACGILSKIAIDTGLDSADLEEQLQNLKEEFGADKKAVWERLLNVENTAEGAYEAGTIMAQAYGNADESDLYGAIARDKFWNVYGVIIEENAAQIEVENKMGVSLLSVAATLKITSQPANVTAAENTEAVFKVSAEGDGITYQWQWKKPTGTTWANCSSTTSGYNTNTLKPVATSGRNGYSYRCILVDASGKTVTTNAATLTVSKNPVIITQPANVTAAENTTAEITIEATGNNLTYQWQWKKPTGSSWSNCSSTTVGYNTATLKPVATSGRNGYQYRCILTDAAGNTTTSETAVLTVVKGLAIIKQPVDVTVNENETAVFTVSAAGTGLTYQWQWKKPTGTSWSNCSSTTVGYNTATLKPVGTSGRNGYQYRCIITDSDGKSVTSDIARLTVGSTFAITKQPTDVTAGINDTASFTVSAAGTGLTYQWQFKKPTGTSWTNCSSATEGYNTATLKPVATSGRNGYFYRCIITDKNGNSITSESARLIVENKLTITEQPTNVTANVDETAAFTVVASGSELTYQWQFKKPAATSWTNCSSATAGYNTATLKPVATSGRNGYQYRCIIKDKNGNSVTSAEATLTVVQKPKITLQPVSVTVDEDEAAVFTVTATGQSLTYQWQFKKPDSTKWTNCTSTTQGYRKATLKPVATMARNGYQYRCVITDANGNKVTSQAATLNVVESGLKVTFIDVDTSEVIATVPAVSFEGVAGMSAGDVVYVSDVVGNDNIYDCYTMSGGIQTPLDLNAVVYGSSARYADLNFFFYITDSITVYVK